MKYRARWYNADSVVAGLHDNEIIEVVVVFPCVPEIQIVSL